MASANPSMGGFLTLLRKRNFLRLWLAQVISMTMLSASNYALLQLINGITGESADSTIQSSTCFSLAIASVLSLPVALWPCCSLTKVNYW